MLKSLYVSTYISVSVTGLVAALVMLAGAGLGSPWLGTALACAGPVAFFAGLRAADRTHLTDLHAVLAAGVVGTLVAVVQGGLFRAAYSARGGGRDRGTPRLRALVLAVQGVRERRAARGGVLPAFALVEDGRAVASAALVEKPAL
jgi:hypothetical protein